MAHQALIGQPAPHLTLPNYTGEPYSLKPGENDVTTAIFFYPRSGTWGCTKQACQFRDAIAERPEFQSDKVQVIGISPDPVWRQKLFVEKQNLTYPVLSDEKGEARRAYHVGRGLWGLADLRVTFVIDSKGIIRYGFPCMFCLCSTMIGPANRDALDTTSINYASHCKFVSRVLETLRKEGDKTAQISEPVRDEDASYAGTKGSTQ
ncbi:peroxiredoxin Q [Armillaria novae-zelandiae]|uniref:thioredoxin-dependent peroxiredoxin n=1 Tax=Armillaria novae-zelandiae TaxID=153914 RepID=A0AA39UFL2_9AGAR|nr:peroxiredoxin Q [Armillaria novae-zelandiae]